VKTNGPKKEKNWQLITLQIDSTWGCRHAEEKRGISKNEIIKKLVGGAGKNRI
jgi:hypothetical protein